MCEDCMYLEYDEATKQYICSIEYIMDEDDLARMNGYYSKRCPYYKQVMSIPWFANKTNEL